MSFIKKERSHKSSIACREHKKHLESLANQLYKSRIAVQQIGKYQGEQKSPQMVEDIRGELKQVMILLKNQEKKQSVLKDLVGMLTDEMTKIQVKENQLNERDEMELDKKIKQLRNDIDEINLKKNHEVAKITELKEKASQNRSQRVVFSNVFKKIEKELKQHQQAYKDQILNSENYKANFELHDTKTKHKSRAIENEDFHNNQYCQSSHSTPLQHKSPNLEHSTLPETLLQEQLIHPTMGIRNIVESRQHETQSRGKQRGNFTEPIKRKTGFTSQYDSLRSSKLSMLAQEVLINQLHEIIDRFRNATGSRSVAEAADMLESIEMENSRICLEIQELQEKTEEFVHKKVVIEQTKKEENMRDEVGDIEEREALESTLAGFKFLQQRNQRKMSKQYYIETQHKINQYLASDFYLLRELQQTLGIEFHEPQSKESPHLSSVSQIQFLQQCQIIDETIEDMIMQVGKQKPVEPEEQEEVQKEKEKPVGRRDSCLGVKLLKGRASRREDLDEKANKQQQQGKDQKVEDKQSHIAKRKMSTWKIKNV